jgi:chromate reductase, NAD(P)H dehydrogenase (quinone)
MAKLLFFSGSIRSASFNKKLANQAFTMAQRIGSITSTYIDLTDFEMPLYNGDLEEKSGLPVAAQQLKKLFVEHDGIFIASPEYNSSISPLLKNSLDWISRKGSKDEPPLIAFHGKVFALASASPGALGGIRGLVPLRLMLSNINALVIPTQVSISAAHEAFDETGNLKDKKHETALSAQLQQLIEITTKQTQ